jgi:UDP-N-acetylmuramyl pentapeptide phosphotransferase/UDP-N-acetylglucosamine-1-phosphate transferase
MPPLSPLADLAAAAAVAALLAWAATGLSTRPQLPREVILPALDPRPVQGAVVPISILVGLTTIWLWPVPQDLWPLLGAAAGLALLGWVDRQGRLWMATRLSARALAIAVILSALPEHLRLLPGMTVGVERLLLGCAWLAWLQTHAELADVEGLSTLQTALMAAASVGVLLWQAGLPALSAPSTLVAAILFGVAAGSLMWHWPAARIRFSAAGAVPLALVTGWLLLELARQGYAGAALVLPLCLLSDAALTTQRRLATGQPPWHAHRDHATQRAASAGGSRSVLAWTTLAGVALAALACAFATNPLVGVASALPVVAGWLLLLSGMAAARIAR